MQIVLKFHLKENTWQNKWHQLCKSISNETKIINNNMQNNMHRWLNSKWKHLLPMISFINFCFATTLVDSVAMPAYAPQFLFTFVEINCDIFDGHLQESFHWNALFYHKPRLSTIWIFRQRSWVNTFSN